jgi:hypothetical protein
MDTDTVSAAGHSLLPIGAAHRGVIRRTHGRGPSAAADHHGCFGNTCGSTQVFLYSWDPKISFYKLDFFLHPICFKKQFEEFKFRSFFRGTIIMGLKRTIIQSKLKCLKHPGLRARPLWGP